MGHDAFPEKSGHQNGTRLWLLTLKWWVYAFLMSPPGWGAGVTADRQKEILDRWLKKINRFPSFQNIHFLSYPLVSERK